MKTQKPKTIAEFTQHNVELVRSLVDNRLKKRAETPLNSAKNINRQLCKIELALRNKRTDSQKYCQLYAAQQAIQWVLNPNIAAEPYDTIMAGKIFPLS